EEIIGAIRLRRIGTKSEADLRLGTYSTGIKGISVFPARLRVLKNKHRQGTKTPRRKQLGENSWRLSISFTHPRRGRRANLWRGCPAFRIWILTEVVIDS